MFGVCLFGYVEVRGITPLGEMVPEILYPNLRNLRRPRSRNCRMWFKAIFKLPLNQRNLALRWTQQACIWQFQVHTERHSGITIVISKSPTKCQK